MSAGHVIAWVLIIAAGYTGIALIIGAALGWMSSRNKER